MLPTPLGIPDAPRRGRARAANPLPFRIWLQRPAVHALHRKRALLAARAQAARRAAGGPQAAPRSLDDRRECARQAALIREAEAGGANEDALGAEVSDTTSWTE